MIDRRFASIASLAALLLTACATRNVDQVEPGAAPLNDADAIAALLATAAKADANDDLDVLRDALRRLDEVGGKPSDDASAQIFAGWRARVPDLPPRRGRTLGPGFRAGSLAGGRSLRLDQTFLAGQSASVAFSTSSDAHLQLDVRTERRSICSESGQRRTCRWIPTFSSRHAIALRNPGRKNVRYFLVID